MPTLGLEAHVVDADVRARSIARFRERGIVLPTFAQLADPTTIPTSITARLADIDPDAPHPLNLFRIHWHNAADRKGFSAVPGYVVLPRELTGVAAPIIVALGERFPMIAAHKVLAAYGCLAPRLVTGQFDPTRHRAIWPSTGNYCRGGIAVSRIMDCHGVAILPEGMSQERFDWLDNWVKDPSDIVRTPGSESNVKEIYDECNRLAADEENVIFNQFAEFGNVLAHRLVTGRALGRCFEDLRSRQRGLELFAFTSATGSAGTISAGDWLKSEYGTRIVAVEAAECPTLLRNGFGEHNIQGIGDKHVPYVHNVWNTDLVVAVSDAATDSLYQVFQSEVGRAFLAERHGVSQSVLSGLDAFGFSGLANVLAAIKTAKYYDLGPDQAIVTVATDGGSMYRTELDKVAAKHFPHGVDTAACAEVFGRYMLGAGVDNLAELSRTDKERMFNLGYYTWVEQQGVAIEDFVARREQQWWRGLGELVPRWDALIDGFNAEAGA